jgi:hypothetical protein
MKGKRVAVPLTGTGARPTEKSVIPEQFTFTKMRFRRKATKTGSPQWKGRAGTYLISGVGVFQRLAKRGLSRILYAIMPASTLKRIPTSLQMEETAQKMMATKFSEYFRQFFNRFTK